MSGDHYSDDYRHGYTNGHAAGRQAAYDGEEPKGYGQALRDMTTRALDAEQALRTIEERLRVDAAPLAKIAQDAGTREAREAWKAVYSSAVHAQAFIPKESP